MTQLQLHIEDWKTFEHCGFPLWFVWYMLIGATLTCALYFVFAGYNFWIYRKGYSGAKIIRRLTVRLTLVFTLCGIIHVSHALGKFLPASYVVTLAYLVLVPAMISLALAGKRSYEILKTLKTQSEIDKETRAKKHTLLNDVENSLSRLNISDNMKAEIKAVINEKRIDVTG